MKKLLTIMTSTILGITAISNSNLISQFYVSHKLIKNNNINNNVKDNSNPYIKNVLSKSRIVGLISASNGSIYAAGKNFIDYSTDGVNFQQIKTNIEANSIVISSNGYIYIGSNNGLYYSTDDCKTFQKVNSIENNIVSSITVSLNGYIYVNLENSGLWYSTDGINFKKTNVNNVYGNISVSSNGSVYVTDGNGNLFIATDGINFKKISVDINFISLCVGLNGYIYATTVVDGSYYSTDDGKTFQKLKGEISKWEINSFFVSSNGNIYAVSNSSGFTNLFVTNDGINFVDLNIDNNGDIGNISQLLFLNNNNNFYISSYYSGIWKFDLTDNLISYNKPNLRLNNNFIYNQITTININAQYLQSASLDGNNLILPSNNLNLDIGKHVLILTMKKEYKQYALVNGGVNGIITYNFWIKNKITDSYYNVNKHINLEQGLVSNKGNTNNCNIVQTSNEQGSKYSSALTISLQDKFIDFNNSYYVSGTVDTNNDFTATGSKVFLINNQFTIKNDGIYQLHLVDKVGNIQDTYLELGNDNWKLQGTFDDATFQSLAKKLNVTPSVTGQDKEKQAMAWLNQYKSHADNVFIAEVKKYGAGFNITVADLAHSYKSFLDSTTVTDQGLTQKVNINELDNAIKNAVQNKINSGLNTVSSLTKKYNISTNNVIDSNSLNSYVSWINNYDSWFNKNETTILTNEINKVSHGYASQSEIKNILANINTLTIFNNVNWNVKTDSNYQQFINYQNLNQAILKADSSQTWEVQYQADLKIQESNLNLHGYKIVQVLGNKQEPQTKSQMENYDNSGKSFHTWLQTEANSKYHKYQLDTGLEIGLPLFVLVSLISLTWYYRNTKKYKLFVFKRTNIKNKEKVDD